MRRTANLALAAAFAFASGAAPPRPAPRAPLFISPMGEPFRDGSAASALERWLAGADADGDGTLTAAELERDGARFFATLDVDGDGEIEPVEINRYEREIAPEIQLGTERLTPRERRRIRRSEIEREEAAASGRVYGGSRYGEPSGLEGAGRFGLINIPEPVMDADADLNRGVSRAEFAAAAGRRFLLLDGDKDGRLTRAELIGLLPRQDARRDRYRGR
jgi:EF hand domain-containing protein